MTHRTGRQAGFSLIEIIAALLLLAIAFAALMQVAGGSIALTNNAADHAQAAMWARSLMDSAGVEQKLQPGTTSGNFDQQYRWRLQVAPYQVPDAGNNTASQVYKLDLDVYWGGARERSAHFSTLRLVTAIPQQQGLVR
ncbi:prepilin-type N-terminal cleavage/methylation domain-containing protein [Dyella sp.]|uniref:prepilin-type N-terminal cleavage/methylation domain-containing protein n=1 Tax=Dyella sp. TaxID=1869338 RepID=UPI002ED5723D